jgi:hypothetical protein
MSTATPPRLDRLPRTVRAHVERQLGPYDPGGEVDLAGFAGSLTLFGASAVAASVALRAGGRDLPTRYGVADLLLGGVAVHKFSRLLAKGSVTSPLRAPFTEFDGPGAPAEHRESPRGDHGLRHTVGELLTCPFCLSVWVSAGYVVGLAAAPRPARAWAAVFAVTAVSDALQHLYARIQD